MNWDPLWDRTSKELEAIASSVRAEVPTVLFAVRRLPPTSIAPFQANIEFAFPHRYNDTPWGVDLFIQITCGLIGRVGFRDPDGKPLELAREFEGRFALNCELGRGDGELLDGLHPLVLPVDSGSDEFGEAAKRFLSQSIAFCRAEVPRIVTELKGFA